MPSAPIKGLILADAAGEDDLAVRLHGRSRYVLPLANRVLVRYGIDALAGCGIGELAVAVSSAVREDVEAVIGDGRRLGVRVQYLEHGQELGVATTLREAREALGPGPIAVHAGDALLTGSLTPLIEQFQRAPAEVLLVTGPAVAAATRAPAGARPRGRTGRLGALAELDSSPPAALFSDSGVRALEEIERELAEDSCLGAAAAALAEAGRSVVVQARADCWSYQSDCDALLEANRMVLDQAAGEPAAGDLEDTRLEGRVMIDPTAMLQRTTVRGPAVIGPGAELSDAFVGPYTSIGANVSLEGAELEHSIVLAGASVRHVKRRIEASVIGSGARVGHDFGLPAALRLQIGRGSKVILA